MSTVKTAELVAIDERRLLRRLDDLAQRGALPGGGIFRALYTPAWTSAMELVTTWLKEGQLLTRRDAVGNVWGRIEGSRGGRAIVTGSHIDTVRGGGALDGALGLVAGIEAVTSLWERFGRPTRTLECVAICEEEGSRFDTNFWGARAIADRIEPNEAERTRDAAGTSLADAMRSVGLDPANAVQAVRRDIDVFVELHIEQGPVLEDHGPRLGVVTTIAGTIHQEIVVRGQPDHAGAMAMSRRHDALVGASAMTLAIAELATRMGDPAVATVGTIVVEPAQEAAVLLADRGRRPLGRGGPVAGQPAPGQRRGREPDPDQEARLDGHHRERRTHVEPHAGGEPRQQQRRDAAGEDGQQRRHQHPPAGSRNGGPARQLPVHHEPSTSGTKR